MDLHLAAVDSNGTIWHAIRHGDGTWTPPGNVDAVVGNPGGSYDVQVAAVVDQLHLVAHTLGFWGGDQTLWHTIRHGDGSWTPFVNLNNVLSPPGMLGFLGDGLAIISDSPTLHLGAVTSDLGGSNGTIRHAIRFPNGTWTPLGNVNQVVGHSGSFAKVAVAEVAGELHLTGLDGTTIWHAIRHRDGSWTPFGNVNAVVGDPGGGFWMVALTGVNEELHLVGLGLGGRSWHTIRHVDGSWTPFGDIAQVVGPEAYFFAVALGAITDSTNAWELHLVGLGVGGVLWHTIRKQDGSWTPLENLNETLGGGPFRYASLAGAKQPTN